jgi:hypothetical protein
MVIHFISKDKVKNNADRFHLEANTSSELVQMIATGHHNTSADKTFNFLIHDFHVLCALQQSMEQHTSNVKDDDKLYKARHAVLPSCWFLSDYNVDVSSSK